MYLNTTQGRLARQQFGGSKYGFILDGVLVGLNPAIGTSAPQARSVGRPSLSSRCGVSVAPTFAAGSGQLET